MAKAKHGAKTQAVREYVTANPTATTNDVMSAMKAVGLKVSKPMIYAVKGKLGGAPKKRGRKKGSAAKKNGQMISLDMLLKAKKMIEEFGSVEKAQQAMDALAKLQ